MATESLAELARIADDVYVFRYQNHAGMFIVSDTGVLLCDPIGEANPRTPHMIKEAIRSVTDQPVKYVVYSHSASDHSTGGAAFADTAEFVGHKNCATAMAARNLPDSPPPKRPFDEQLSLDLGGKKIDLYSADLWQKDDYLILHYPQSKVVMTVDFVQPKNVPFRTMLGHPDRVAEKLQWIHDKLDFEALVSGHTQPYLTGTKEDVLEQRQYLLDLKAAVEHASAHPANSQEMVNAVRAELAPKYGNWRRFDEFLALNVQGAIAWLAGETPNPRAGMR